ncbi:IS1634-like element ISMsm6 family transposase [Mycolicibacterium smegmatis]|uniref:ISMsm6, transposase n=1 Tax=Mycolicibacterium smegmatis (strain MKD8) TaxID=1214915 RepID=A0A2U9PZ17_MYCSE|nr:IS1634-like element ISMsm6 family transposase [Mycolicibacterium smegmatis]AWT51061.1 ISMsm6, transposase [Mycolicibacterium smegmatis MKD8]AWT51076.1 ISMsm6, transposase [Mycolicibacterium smegmatis MKD8]AWT51861.1 ISMsm6, transposase [Mycolicibacterium smegmatis MKD8]AWT56964.1 ISMsm6, transposase [Mycolicibacterium smegmatis MKD8]AWT56968.1 ISMsm6, transposase [Mycolicibacterium smegmatis MKD8]
MAYVRKVRTASGAVAVQVARKDAGKVVILAHLGSAHTDAELGILLEQAKAMVIGGQVALDFEVAARAQSMADVADFREQRVLGEKSGPSAAAPVVPPGRTVGASSRLLYDLLGHVYDWLGFDTVGDAVFRDLVIARIVEPTSKLDASRVLADLGAQLVSYKTIDRHVRTIHARGHRDVIAEKCFAYATDCGGLSLILYDVTTLYFAAESEDSLRKVGYSKERRVDPQIVVGLLVDRTGFPLEIGCFEGNTAETTTIVPIITSFLERHNLVGTPMVVAADAGMLSQTNLTALDEQELSFIVGSRMTKAPGDLESHFHWNGDVFTDGQIIDTVTPRHGNTRVNDIKKRAEPVWDPERDTGAWRAIWSYSAKRARRDQKTLAAQEARARAIVAGEKKAKTARFVKTHGADRALDQASLARAQSLVGLKGYVTNIPVTVMPAAEVIAKYHDLWHVEKSFRMSKSDLDARPMFNRIRDAIEAHLTIVFAALAVSHTIQSRTGLSIAKVIKLLRPLRSATITINGATQTFPPAIPDTERQILTNLGFNPGY